MTLVTNRWKSITLELCFLIFSPQVVQTRYQKSDLLKQFQKTICFNTDSS